MAASLDFEGEFGKVKFGGFADEPKRPLEDGRANPAVLIRPNNRVFLR
jgi:hypothetical protein